MEEQQIQKLIDITALIDPPLVLTTITLDGKTYYSAENVYNNTYLRFFIRNRIYDRKNIRKIITNANITPDNYVYAYMRGGEWTLSDANNKRAKLLLTTEWINNIPAEMMM